jgi:flavin reductase (DIM6/NTAB) family NADH-FMN oxidoreductase RutF
VTIAADEFKMALQNWASGVTVITTQSQSFGLQGMTASSFSSVSMEPPQILVCINKSVSTVDGITESGIFAINILNTEQETTSNLFSNPNSYADRFSTTAHEPGKTGAPLLTESMISIECTVVEQVSAASHWILIGEVQNTVQRSGEPLLYYKAAYRQIASN